MVKLAGPMFSMDASGTIGNAVTFSKSKGRPYARVRVIPSNPKSGPQVGMRSMMRFLSQEWAGMSDPQKASWETRAKATNISEFNAFCSYNMARWRHFTTPSKVDPAAEISTTPAAPTTTITPGVRQLQLSIADGAQVPDWGWLIFRSLTTGFTPAYSNLVQVVPRSATPTVYIDAELTAVPYYYRIKGIMIDGVAGTLEAETTGTPTS
jgi:hypothetical protein